MSDEKDESQKTEEPTPKKLQEAMDKGEVAKSQEVRHWFILFAITIVVMIAAKPSMGGLKVTLGYLLSILHNIPMDGNNLLQFFTSLFSQILQYMTLPIIILVSGALAGAMIQHRPMLSVEKITPKLNKISPLAGFKRLFSMQNFVEFAKSILKLCIVTSVVFILVWPDKDILEQMMTHDLEDVTNIIFMMTLRILGGVVSVMFVIAIADFMFQKFQFLKKMRMTKQEIKDEMKQTDGDPHVKARLRQIRMERARGRMMAAVPEADVVITNPTHYAVAMKYSHGDMDVPRVVAKGVDNIAMKIREIAEENKVPILENPPLARTLYASVEVDEEIQPEQYQAVAEVISFVMRLKRGERVSYKAG